MTEPTAEQMFRRGYSAGWAHRGNRLPWNPEASPDYPQRAATPAPAEGAHEFVPDGCDGVDTCGKRARDDVYTRARGIYVPCGLPAEHPIHQRESRALDHGRDCPGCVQRWEGDHACSTPEYALATEPSCIKIEHSWAPVLDAPLDYCTLCHSNHPQRAGQREGER